jgi:deazaflavin-dependent oxidoreductase (nitroreductase family)
LSDRIVELSTDGWIAEHREQYLKSGTSGHLWDSSIAGGPGPLPTLLLFTVGRRTGRESVMPLLYGELPSGYAVIASRGGHERHPGWYHNLVACPSVSVKLEDETFKASTRITDGQERKEIWQQMVALYPPFAGYEVKAAPREIPVVVLERLG